MADLLVSCISSSNAGMKNRNAVNDSSGLCFGTRTHVFQQFIRDITFTSLTLFLDKEKLINFPNDDETDTFYLHNKCFNQRQI